MGPGCSVRAGFASRVLGRLVGHVSPMHYFDLEWVVVVEDHCGNLEVAERHAMSRHAWGGRPVLIPDFRSWGISHRPGAPGPFQLKGFGSAPRLKGADLFAVATCAHCTSPDFPNFCKKLTRQLGRGRPGE